MEKRSKMKVFGIVMALMLVTVLMLGVTRPAQAAEIREDGVLKANETIDDDLLISGETVRIDGTVNGMLVAVGNTVTLNGKVNGDALLFAQTVIVSEEAVIDGNLFSGAQKVEVYGSVSGSIAAGSAAMITGSEVGRNIYYGGYSLETTKNSSVERGLYFGGYQSILNGSIARDLNAATAALELNGSVGGDALVRIGRPGRIEPQPAFFGLNGPEMPATIPSGMRVGDNAKINGRLVYTSESNQNTAVQAAPAGGIVYQTPVPQERGSSRPVVVRTVSPAVTWLFDFFREFLTLLVLGLLAVWLLPAAVNRGSEIARAQPVRSAGYGLITIIAVYAAAVVAAILILVAGLFLALITLGGLSTALFGIGFSGLALVLAAFTLVVSYVSKLVVAYLVGDLLLAGAAPNLQGRRYWAMVIGVLLYALVHSIPFVGWIIGILVTIVGVGALWMLYRSRQSPMAAVEAAI